MTRCTLHDLRTHPLADEDLGQVIGGECKQVGTRKLLGMDITVCSDVTILNAPGAVILLLH
jgi:hypothetical protein